MSKTPTKPGLFWAALDDGDGTVEIVLLKVSRYSGTSDFADGAVIEYLDDSGRFFEMKTIDDEICKPFSRGEVAFVPVTGRHREVRITWHGEAKPPRSAVQQLNDAIEAGKPAPFR